MEPSGLDGFALCADYCFNTGPFLSPAKFAEFVTPYLAELTRGDEELAGDGQVDATSRSQRRGRFRERLIRRATHYFAAVSDASRSARKRSTTALALASNDRVSPITPPARSRARVPTSPRSDTNAVWRSASI